MARLDKTFPTGDCATCIISPKLVECMRDHNIDVLTMADVIALQGEAGPFPGRSAAAAAQRGCRQVHRLRRLLAGLSGAVVPQPTPAFQPACGWTRGRGLARYSWPATRRPAPLIPFLQDINDQRRYLPQPMLEYLAVRLDIPLAEILRVASFYNAFSLEPVGRHVIEICLGTACFVRGSGMLMERLEGELGIRDGGTDGEGRFTLRSVRCIGCCALAPAMRIGGSRSAA